MRLMRSYFVEVEKLSTMLAECTPEPLPLKKPLALTSQGIIEHEAPRRSGLFVRQSEDEIGKLSRYPFATSDGAWRTIQGYEVLDMIRKGQVRWLPKGDVLGQIQFIRETLGLKS